MNEKNPELNRYREMIYRLLSSVYINEIDSSMLGALKEMDFPEISEPAENWQKDLAEGFGLVKQYLAGFDGKSEQETAELLEDLAADYAKTFLAAGDAAGKAAFPYESVYTGSDSQFGGSLQEQLNADYLAKGFTMKKDMFRIMEDHIGLELLFMAELLKMQEDTDGFFKEHLLKWYRPFANDVYRYSERDFYKGVSRITLGFLAAESELIQL